METNGTAPTPRHRRASAPDAGSPGLPGSLDAPPASGPNSDSAPELVQSTGIPEATLASLDLRQGGIGRLDAQDVSVVQGGIGLARAETIRLELGGLGAALAEELHASQAGIGMVVVGSARLEQSVVRTMIARDVHVERPTLVGVLIARRVRGDVRVLLDWRGALAFGAAFGLLSLVGRGRRRR